MNTDIHRHVRRTLVCRWWRFPNERQNKVRRTIVVICLILTVVSVSPAQDSRELQQEKVPNAKLKGEHPLIPLMGSLTFSLKPELVNVHPRVYVTEQELQQLRVRARTTHRELWQQALQNIRALKNDPPVPPAQQRREQNEVGLAIAEAAFAYQIEKDKRYLVAAKKYMNAAVSYDIWGYTNNKPNVDLAAGHLLYGLGWGYDLLYNDLSQNERARYREKLIRQGRLLAEYFKPKSGKTYAYSQNHTFIPIAGLGVAAYALYGETDEAAEWARLARAIFDRVLDTYSRDAYYYEGFEYWIFSTPWLIHYLDAHAHATGEDLYDRPGFREMYKYVAHSMLPTGNYVFDFGDIFEGPLTRAGKGNEYPRTHPQGHFNTNYNLLYRLAQRFHSGEAQGVAQWLKGFNQVNAEDYWSLIWFDFTLESIAIEKQSTFHYFRDHDVVFWRSSWAKDATAFAFKCGPSEGHHTFDLLSRFPDWRLSSGHAHPDANSFIIFANGQYLTGDTGYAGVPMTQHHNTVLFNGKGQAKEGSGHDAFDGVSYDRLNAIKIAEVKVEKNTVRVVGNATTAYEPELGVQKFVRNFEYSPVNGFKVMDEIETSKPSIVTSVIHADGVIDRKSGSEFVIPADGTKLLIEPLEPKDLTSAIEANVLTAPGPPGSVDKGERQERGYMLKLSTRKAVTWTVFVLSMQVRPETSDKSGKLRP